MPLSRREQQILAQIEDEFTTKNAGMAAAVTGGPARRLPYSPAVRTWLGLLGLLTLGLAVIPLGVLLLGPGPVGLGILTLGVVAPWTLVAAARLARGTADE